MEFSFDIERVLPGRITVIEYGDINESDIRIFALCTNNDEESDPNSSWIYHSSANAPWDVRLKKKKEDLATIIDKMGYASAQAQSLRSPITSLKKLLNSKHQKIYMMRDEKNKTVIGFLKIGVKRLFISDEHGAHHEVDPLCILDFYVHESKQRCGFGHEIFNIMLETENVSPEKLSIDRPSLKFLSFLSKHYNLKDPIVQSNNFVIYPGFFIDREVTRPPIFLYNGKAMQPVKCNNLKKQYSSTCSYVNEGEALNSIKVPLSSDELKKNKTYYSSAAKCLMWNDEGNVTSRNKQYHNSNSSALTNSNSSREVKTSCHWNVRTTTQSCSDAHKQMDGWNSSHSTPWDETDSDFDGYQISRAPLSARYSSLTPVNNVPNYSRRKWEQLQSSWNILGVKPVDYSIYQNQN